MQTKKVRGLWQVYAINSKDENKVIGPGKPNEVSKKPMRVSKKPMGVWN